MKSWKTTLSGALNTLGKTIRGIPLAMLATNPDSLTNPDKVAFYSWFYLAGLCVSAVGQFFGSLFSADAEAPPATSLAPGLNLTLALVLGLLGLALVSPASARAAQSVTLAWNANSETNLAGYRLYMGTAPRTYDPANTITILTPSTTGTMTNLVVGKMYYFAVTAFTDDGLESDYSEEVSYGIKPSRPTDLHVTIQTAQTATGPWKNVFDGIYHPPEPAPGEAPSYYRGIVTLLPSPR